jgi:class 3 adenylate cyclase/tetratricopeptide (TPR) repeat protein
MVFADVSGFTRLSERLARVGKEGAEHLVDTINACFSALLADAYAHGGSLLKFGGDALLLWFEGADHAIRGCASAALMRSRLRSVGRIETGAGRVVLRMSVGVHSGWFETFLVGDSHREYLIAGPAAGVVVALESAASAGQILLSRETAALLPRSSVGATVGPGVLLARLPSVPAEVSYERLPAPPDEAVALCLPTAVRAHVAAAPVTPEHRNATVGFVQFGGLDEMIARDGQHATAEAVDELVRVVSEGCDLFQVSLLGSDIGADGGKFQLASGAPRALGDNEERMLLAVRHVIDRKTRLPVRAGVTRGHVFTGEIGPPYRRTYVAMGDAVNLAARIMAKAPWGTVYAREGVLERSKTSFHSTSVAPFMVKGKLRPVQAVSIGPMRRPVPEAATASRLPLVGRDRELATIRDALAGARAGRGGMIEIVGETGSGKSRLLSESRDLADGLGFAHTICENYRRTVPYVVWRDILRQLLGLHWDDPDDVVIAAIAAQIEASGRRLEPWLPLLAIAFDAQVPMTREVSELAASYRAAKLHEVVIEFLEPLLTVPMLIQIEHAHFMDEASAALLHALAGQLESSTWLVTVTRRDVTDGFVGAPESATLLTLGPLSAAAMMELAESTAEASVVPPHVLEMAVERAGGSPEFLLDLLATAAGGSEELPDSMGAAATARIDELDPSDRVLVRRASVLGLCFHPRLLRYVLDPNVSDPDERTWTRMSGVFADDGDGYVRFKRPALCEAAYEGLPFRVRRQLHSAVGHALEPDVGRDADADPAVLSVHFIRAGDYERAWTYACIGAERASARFAHADASNLYRLAIDAGREGVATRVELANTWEALAEGLRHSGQPVAASDALSEARRLSHDDPLRQARLLYRHADIAARRERLSASVRWINRGLRALDGLESDEAIRLRARLQARLAGVRVGQGRAAEAVKLCQTMIPKAEAAGELRALARACYLLDSALAELGREPDAVHSARALEIYRELGDREMEAMVLNNLGAFAYFRGEWDEAIRRYRESAECSIKAGNASNPAFADTNVGEILSDQGRFGEAATQLSRARRLWSATGDQQATAFVDVLLGRMAVRTGSILDGLKRLAQAADTLHRLGMKGYAEWARLLIAEAEAIGGDAQRALDLAHGLRDTADWYVPLLHRIRGFALMRLEERALAVDAMLTSLAAARKRAAEYDVASALDALEALGPPDAERSAERDEIVARLGIQRLILPEGRTQPAPPEQVPALAGT